MVVGNGHDTKLLITITVNEIQGNQVRLGIDATDELTVHRSELWARINGIDNPVTGSALRREKTLLIPRCVSRLPRARHHPLEHNHEHFFNA